MNDSLVIGSAASRARPRQFHQHQGFTLRLPLISIPRFDPGDFVVSLPPAFEVRPASCGGLQLLGAFKRAMVYRQHASAFQAVVYRLHG